MVAQWMRANDGGWDGILNWTEEADQPMPRMPVAPPQPVPMPIPAAATIPARLIEGAPDYNGGPTPEAKMECSVKRSLSQFCAIKSMPVSMPVLYQYQYMYQYQYVYKC